MEQQGLAHKDVEQLLMSENEQLQQQVIRLRHDLVTSSHHLHLHSQFLILSHLCLVYM